MKSVPCQQCGHEIECARHVISEACPTCGALVDVAAWRPLWAVQDLEDKIRQQLDLPPDLRAQMLAKTAERRDALRRELTSVPLPGRAPTPPPLPMAARTEARPEAREAREAPEAPPPVVDYREARRLQKEEARRKRAEDEAARRAARGPTVWERLGPATMENLGFALASFLIVAGAIYFATTAWTTMSGEERLLVVTGGLVLLGGVLFAAGRLLNRGGTIPEVERVLLLVCCLLVPVAAVPAGNLLGLSLGLGVLAALLVVGPGFLTARALGKNLDPALWPFFPLAFTVLASLPLAGSMVGRAPLLSAGITAALLIASVMGYARWVVPRAAEPRATFLWPPLLLAFAALVFAGRTAIAAAALGAETGRVFATVGIVLSAVAVAVTTMEAALGKRGLFGGGRSAVLLVIAIAVSVTGTVFALGDDVGLAIAAALGAWAAIRAGLALPVPWLAIPGLVLSVIAYLKSPSPIREAVLRLRDQVAAELGYVDEPLPLAWYGLTFLPYVAACGVAGWWLLRRKRRGEATVLLTWTFLIAAGLTALSLLQGWDVTKWDLRAPAAVLGAQGALLFALGWAVRHRWLLFFGALGVYGGAACAALYLFSDPAVILLVLAVAGIVGIAVAAALARGRRRPPFARARAGILDATVVLGLGLVVVALVDVLGETPTLWWHAFAFLALSLLYAALGFTYRRPEGVLLASLALAGASDRVLAAALPEGSPGLHVLLCAALALVPLLAGPAARLFPPRFRYPFVKGGSDPAAWAPAGSLLVQLAGWNLFLASAPLEAFPYSWYLAGGLALGAGVLALAAVLYRQRWPLAFAAPILVAAAFAVTGTLERQVLGTLGLFAVAVALGVLYLPIVWRRPRRVASLAEPGLAEVLSALTGLFVAWAGLLILFRYSPSASELWSAWNGWELAGASLLVAGAARLATASRRHPWDAEAAGVAAGLLFGFAAIGILDAVGATFDWYPLGLLAAAVVTVLWARRVPSLDAPAGVHAVASLALAVALALADYGDPLLLLVSFGAIAAAGRVAAVRAPIGGGVLLLLALLGGLSFVVLVYFLPVHWSLQAAVWIAFAGAALLAWRVPLLGVSRTAARIVAWPILAAAFLAGIASAIWVGVAEPKLMTDPEFVVILAGARWASLALIGASLVHALGGRTPRRRAAPVVAAALASFVYAPINILLQGSADRLWRPDVEVALLAIVLALVLPLGRETRERRASLPPPPLGFAGTWPIVMIACALLLTAGMLRNASTPLAVLAATLAVFVLVVRDHRPGLGHLFGGGLITTAFAFVAWLRPTEGPLAEELLLLLAATAALVAPVLWGIAAGLRGAPPGGWQQRLLAELPGTAVFAGATAFVCAALDTLLYANQPAGGLALAFAFVAYGIPGLGAALSARRTDRPWLIHLAVACGLGLYAFTVQRTELLSILDGKHLHALIGIGGALLLLSEYKRDRTADFLAMDGLLLAVPAVFIYAPRALIPEASAGSVSALALTSIAAAYGARRLAWPALWWVAVALLNLMLFAFWRRHGIVDPAFYGIPPGLSLVAGAVILRNKIARPAALAMLVPGLALLYGSVAIQVFRVGNPVHALVLFGMGLATVALGFVFRRNAWLVTGMTVIVLDVVAYLASHGFETDFFGAALLVAAGLCVFAVAALATARRRRAAETQPSERDANT